MIVGELLLDGLREQVLELCDVFVAGDAEHSVGKPIAFFHCQPIVAHKFRS